MAQCITCGAELHPERAVKYDYCTAPACQEKNAKGLTMVAVGMNKAADELVILDERTREALANGKYQDQRRGSFGPPAPAPGPAPEAPPVTAPAPGPATRFGCRTRFDSRIRPGYRTRLGSRIRPGCRTHPGCRIRLGYGSRPGCRIRAGRKRSGPGRRPACAPASTTAVAARACQRHPAKVDRVAGAARAALQPARAAAGRDRGGARREYLPRDPDGPRGQEPSQGLSAPGGRAAMTCR